ncbi:MAG: leucyl/phenylalanyl-tRNA--protein transferase [Bdellovibrionia bacterium]
MPIRLFPDPRKANSEGIVAFGGDLSPDTLIQAYRQGIFPWPIPGLPLPWFCPAERAILDIHQLHLSRSLVRFQKKNLYRFTVDQAFPQVIELCAKVPRAGQSGTWITSAMRQAYLQLHELKVAHSVEAWQGDRLVGGLYGVDSGGAFSAESMFHLADHASKLAIVFLLHHLQAQGLTWIDIQVMTPHLQALGAQLLDRDEFLTRLSKQQACRLKIF